MRLEDELLAKEIESMQGCGLHYAAAAIAPSSFAGRNPG